MPYGPTLQDVQPWAGRRHLERMAIEEAVMITKRVKAKSVELLDPGNQAWAKTRASTVVLSPTPLDLQPVEYVRVSWTSRPYGKASSVKVSSLHNGEQIFFRL